MILFIISIFSCKKKTDPPVVIATVSDIDSNVYPTIVLGSQIWMAENLRTTRYNDGILIGTTSPSTLPVYTESAPSYQWISGDIDSTLVPYGRLYTWYALTDSRNICPAGWHVPTDNEWTILHLVEHLPVSFNISYPLWMV